VQNRKVVIALFVLVALAYWISMYLFMPTLPTYVKSKTDNLALVGVILAQYGLWQAIIRLPLGITADWLGRRKPFILIGLLLSALGAWMLGSADGGTQLVIARAITGLGAGTWVPLMVAFNSLFPPRDVIRATAILTFIGSVGRILGTSLTGSLNELGGYQLAFILAAGAGGVGALLLLPIREEPLPVRKPSVQGIGHYTPLACLPVPGSAASWPTPWASAPCSARRPLSAWPWACS
jgi:MFS family permease